jgi:Fe2+ or Zn2+ uptake regulation protein
LDPGKKIPAPEGFTVSSHQLSLYGNCKDCAQEG